MVGMARATLADPQFARKVKEGRVDEIRPCIGCNQGCIGRVFLGFSIECTVNPIASREREWGVGKISVAQKRKRVVVVGGGPAGLKSAEAAALRGHEVILVEKAEKLGGQVQVAAAIPGRSEIAEAIQHLALEIVRLGVSLRLNAEASEESVLELKPDAVIVATGSCANASSLHPARAHANLYSAGGSQPGSNSWAASGGF